MPESQIGKSAQQPSLVVRPLSRDTWNGTPYRADLDIPRPARTLPVSTMAVQMATRIRLRLATG